MAVPPSNRLRPAELARVALVLAVIAGLFLLLRGQDLSQWKDPAWLRGRVGELGPWMILIYMGFWLASFTLLAQTVLPTVAGGLLFGWFAGSLLAVAGLALGSALQFGLVRWAFQGPAQRILFARYPELKHGIEERGLGLLLLLRLVWFPTWILNAAAAVTQLRFRSFLASVAGMLPGAMILCLASDSFYTYGLAGMPKERWAGVAALLLGTAATWFLARRRWPELRGFTVKSSRDLPHPRS
jgi:uncharacterized membrane protein YdjX (TVP38/TMEM64 family)